MKTGTRTKVWVVVLAALAVFHAPARGQAVPPPVINYEGVLVDNLTGAPFDGAKVMMFVYYTTPGGGDSDQILQESHTGVAGVAGPVQVSNGLFNALLGTGQMVDGTGTFPNGPYTSLAQVFRDFDQVWLEVRIESAIVPGGFETLAPRTRVVSAAYALNAKALNGKDGSTFLDMSAAPQTKLGSLGVDSLQVNGDLITFDAPGAMITADGSMLQMTAGDDDTDTLWLQGGNGPEDGRIVVFGDNWIEMHSPLFSFHNATGAQTASLDGAGNLQFDGDVTVSGGDIRFGAPGAELSATSLSMGLQAGDADTDDLYLSAGNTLDDGSVIIKGDSDIELRSADGFVRFVNGATLTGGSIYAGSNLLWLTAGDADTDALYLVSGDSLDDGYLAIYGNSYASLTSGNGDIRFRNGATNADVAILDSLPSETSLVIPSNSNTGPPNNYDYSLFTIDAPEVLSMRIGHASTPTGNLTVHGTFGVVGTKNFVQNHPERTDLSIHYTALEGDEAGTYTRGTARLTDGVARVSLGETFAWVTNPEVGLTAHITPRGEPVPLAVESLTTAELVVRAPADAPPDLAFDYVVHGLRIGWEDFPVVQPKRDDARLPRAGTFAASRGVPEADRASNALERFRAMEKEAGRGAADDAPGEGGGAIGAAEALRRAIGEIEPHERRSSAPDPAEAGPLERAGSGEIPPGGPRPDAGAPVQAHDERSGARVERAREAPASSVAEAPADEDLRPRLVRQPGPDPAARMIVSEPVEPGDVLVADRQRSGSFRPADREADPAVAGVVSVDPGLLPGDDGRDGVPVAFSGVALCRVDAGYGSIEVGDLLTTSSTPGHARRADEPRPGTIVGKALEPLESGTGLIRILVMLR